MEKNNYEKKVISQLFNEQGDLEVNPKKILEIQAKFFTKLYTRDPQVKFELINESDKIILEQQAKLIEEPLSIEELTTALMELNDGKTPGTDGLTTEFYKHFWPLLSQPLLEALQYAKDQGKLHASARRGIVTQIPKKDKDSRYIQNQRPITLLNVDYKILAKVLVNRMQKVLETLISPHQTGFMPGRQIAHNIRKILDIINITKESNQQGIMLSLDFYKCFDTLDHQSILAALKYYSFGEQFTSYVGLLYQDIQSCVLNNGNVSTWFKYGRGSPQGSPASTAIFLICGQIMSDLLEQNPEIQGLEILGHQELIIQFADDTNMFLPYKQQVLDVVFNTLTTVNFQIGLQVSYDKTTIYRLGSLRNTNAALYTTRGVAWTDDPIKVLGVSITDENILEINYDTFIRKAQEVLYIWSKRNPSLMGKVLLINSLVGSLYVYKMNVLPTIESNHVKEFYRIIRKFLWNGKKAKIALSILQADKTEGGLRLVNLIHKDFSLKYLWIKVLQGEGFFARVFYDQLNFPAGRRIWICSINTKDVRKVCRSPFWRDVLSVWNRYNYKNIITPADMARQILWINSLIVVDGKMLYNESAWDAGLMSVGDLYQGTELLSYAQLRTKFGNIMTWFEHYQLINALLILWKRTLATNNTLNVIRGIPMQPNYAARDIYSSLIMDSTNAANKCSKWQSLLHIDLELEDFHALFENIYKLTIATKYRDFQFRLLHHAIVTNRQLFLWGLVPSDQCTFCNEHVETYVHLFYDCTKVRKLWQDIEQWFCYLTSRMEIEVFFSVKNIMLNLVTERKSHVLNLLILIVKQFIYRCRCLNVAPSFDQVYKQILEVCQIEEFIAKRKDKWNYHVKKWKIIKPSLQLQQNTNGNDYVVEYLAQL